MSRDVRVLGVDPGFASFGYAVVQLTESGENVKFVDVVRTQKVDKKRNVKAADDNFQRGQVIAAALYGAVQKYEPMVITAEAASWPRNAGATAKVAMSWGILIALCHQYRLPMVQASPQEIKKTLCDSKSATKESVREALEVRYPGQFDGFKERFPAQKPPKPNGQWEHGFDAVGAVVACLDTEVLRMARGMVP